MFRDVLRVCQVSCVLVEIVEYSCVAFAMRVVSLGWLSPTTGEREGDGESS